MSHWFLNKKHFSPINKAFYPYLKNDMLVLVDGGAAGELSEPFNVSPDIIKSVRFEPRGKEVVNTNNNEIFIDAGIWSSDCIQKLHLAKVPTTSSVCPPDMKYLSKFDETNVGVRRTEKILEIQMRSIDSCILKNEMPIADFIKLDVHSAELPALKGALGNIQNCLGLLVETWHSPVHINQGLHFEIEKFAIDHGFEVYDLVCAARWKHKFENDVDYFERGQYIGSEILFIKKDILKDKILKKAFILCLFGFANEAKFILQGHDDENIKTNLINSILEFQKRRKKSIKLILKMIAFKLLNIFSFLNNL